MDRKTNFDAYLEEQLRDPGFRERFACAGKVWDLVLQRNREIEGIEEEITERNLV